MKLSVTTSWRKQDLCLNEEAQLLEFSGNWHGLLISQPALTLNIKAIRRLYVNVSASSGHAAARAVFSDGEVRELSGTDLEIMLLKILVINNQRDGVDPEKEQSVVTVHERSREEVLSDREKRVKEAAAMVFGAAFLMVSLLFMAIPGVNAVWALPIAGLAALTAYPLFKLKREWSFYVFDPDIEYYNRVALGKTAPHPQAEVDT